MDYDLLLVVGLVLAAAGKRQRAHCRSQRLVQDAGVRGCQPRGRQAEPRLPAAGAGTAAGIDADVGSLQPGRLADVLRAHPDVPYEQRIQAARFIEDLTAGYQGGWYSVISLHGGGSPAAMKQEIWRHYPLGNKVELVERLLERGLTTDGAAAAAPHDPARPITRNRQPGRCCDTGCTTPGQPVMVDLPVPVAKKQN